MTPSQIVGLAVATIVLMRCRHCRGWHDSAEAEEACAARHQFDRIFADTDFRG